MAKKATVRERSAGRLVEVVSYEHIKQSDDPRVRAAKKKKTSEVMAKYNHKTSAKKLELRLAANFDKGDIVGCVTFDEAHLPKTRDEAGLRFKYFRTRVQAAWRKRGLDPEKLIFGWRVEHVHGEGRWHVHFVCTATGDDYNMLRDAWIYGDINEFRPLRVDEQKNYATIANYFTKEPCDKLGQRAWSFSRNAKKPYESSEQVDGSAEIEAPEGVTVLEKHVTETSFGRFFYLMYLLPEAPEELRPRAKRHRQSD